jgi:UDP-N-acetylglucosamine 1-carboxyvinyltransferase
MDKIVVTGGNRLSGEVTISGAKNAALPIMASALLSREETCLSNVPQLMDVATTERLLTRFGGEIRREGTDGVLSIRIDAVRDREAPYELVKTMRASILVLGPLLARCGEARVSLPGGCAIGARPINLHLAGLERMGAEVRIEHGYVVAKAKRLQGARIHFDLPTVTGTENLMMAATLADGITTLENAACEPEIEDLARSLVQRGARISGAGTDTVVIEGVDRLGACAHTVMPDRIEAGTFMAAAAITGGEISIHSCVPGHLKGIILKLRESGCEIREEQNGLWIKGTPRPKAVDVKTLPYPGFPTDMQAQMMALMSVADGLSVITETIFESRFQHAAELRRMGASIKTEGKHAVVRGVDRLTGAPVMASDLRASASLIVAGLRAEGETEVLRVYHLDRGYERIEEKLSCLGAKIRRIKSGGRSVL